MTGKAGPMSVFLVIDTVTYEADDIVAGFTDEADAVKWADTEPLFTDLRTIRRLELNNPESYPEMTEYRRTR